MQYFCKMPPGVYQALAERGVQEEKLFYCVKADMDGEGCYYDTYLTFDKENLYVICGMEKPLPEARKKVTEYVFCTEDYAEYPLAEISKAVIDQQVNTARLVLEYKAGGRKILCRFSIGFSPVFGKFIERLHIIKEGNQPDDSVLDQEKMFCPKCGYRYPEGARKVCPNCTDKISIFRRLLKMYMAYKKQAAAIFTCLVLSSIFPLISPLLSEKMLYDDVLKAGGQFYGQILFIVILIAITRVFGLAVGLVHNRILAKVTPKVIRDIRMKIFSSLQHLSLDFFSNKQTGSLMSRILNDSQQIYQFFIDIIPTAIIHFVTIIGLLGIMLWLNAPLSLFILGCIIVMSLLISRFNKKRRKLHRKRHVAVRGAYGVVSDALNGQRVVKAFAREQNEVKRYSIQNDMLHDVSYEISYRVQRAYPTINTIFRVGSVLLFAIGGWLILTGNFTLGLLTSLYAYAGMLTEPINFFMNIGDRWARCVDAASRMFEILDTEPLVKELPQPVEADRLKGDIRLNDVCFEYEVARPILKNITLSVKQGQMLGIVGKTGAGKTTLINLICRLYDVKSGSITIDGYNIKQLSFESLRRNIGVVSQESYLFMGTVAENIKYASPDASMEEVILAAKTAYAHEFIMKLPEGYDTKIGVGGYAFSGGERQRISIARAILQQPNILILDEATASMDTQTERKIQTAIDQLKQGRTIIAIAHRLSTLRDADNLAVIENGELVEFGTHDELIQKKGAYFNLHSLQTQALQFIETGD